MDQRYSGEAYWDDYHDSGLSQDLDRSVKQEKWLRCFIPVLDQYQLKTVMDLGCGSGYDAMALALSGFYVSGNDISVVAIEHARKQAEKHGLNIDYLVHDIAEPMPYKDKHFDAVICNLTLHMFPAELADEIVAEVGRCLVPGGLFMFHVNSIDDLPYRSKLQPPVVSLGKEFFSFGKGQTMRFFSESACRELMSGWSIILLEPVQMLRPDGQIQKCAWRCIAQKIAQNQKP